MFEAITKRKRLVFDKLLSYGFKNRKKCFEYDTKICGDEFSLTVRISADGSIKTNLIETTTGEEYVVYKTNAAGEYVGKIRDAIESVLRDIVKNCYETFVFKTEQAAMLIEFARERYGDELEFLWEKFPDNAILRRKDNKKWYAAILTVAGKKIGLETEEILEIIDLRMNAADAKKFLSRKNYYPGWHMNKKTWYTLALNGSIPDNELKERVEESYILAGK